MYYVRAKFTAGTKLYMQSSLTSLKNNKRRRLKNMQYFKYTLSVSLFSFQHTNIYSSRVPFPFFEKCVYEAKLPTRVK